MQLDDHRRPTRRQHRTSGRSGRDRRRRRPGLPRLRSRRRVRRPGSVPEVAASAAPLAADAVLAQAASEPPRDGPDVGRTLRTRVRVDASTPWRDIEFTVREDWVLGPTRRALWGHLAGRIRQRGDLRTRPTARAPATARRSTTTGTSSSVATGDEIGWRRQRAGRTRPADLAGDAARHSPNRRRGLGAPRRAARRGAGSSTGARRDDGPHPTAPSVRRLDGEGYSGHRLDAVGRLALGRREPPRVVDVLVLYAPRALLECGGRRERLKLCLETAIGTANEAFVETTVFPPVWACCPCRGDCDGRGPGRALESAPHGTGARRNRTTRRTPTSSDPPRTSAGSRSSSAQTSCWSSPDVRREPPPVAAATAARNAACRTAPTSRHSPCSRSASCAGRTRPRHTSWATPSASPHTKTGTMARADRPSQPPAGAGQVTHPVACRRATDSAARTAPAPRSHPEGGLRCAIAWTGAGRQGRRPRTEFHRVRGRPESRRAPHDASAAGRTLPTIRRSSHETDSNCTDALCGGPRRRSTGHGMRAHRRWPTETQATRRCASRCSTPRRWTSSSPTRPTTRTGRAASSWARAT